MSENQKAAPQVSANNYVQPVPDHCDRIVWRNHYYHLPLARGVAGNGAAEQTSPDKSSGSLSPDPDWLWVQLMDWCKQRRAHPSDYNDLFAIVGRARERNAGATLKGK